MLIVGLTGGIGAGKSTAARLFSVRGAAVIDVDRLGHRVLEPGGRAYAAVIDTFGTGIVGGDGVIDRRALGRIVFSDPAELAKLNSISHPAINDELAVEIDQARARGVDVAILDLALLVESSLGRIDADHSYSVVVTVEAPEALRVERAVARGMDRDDVRRRIAAQASEADRRAVADFVLVNDGDEQRLDAQVDACWQELTRRR